MMHTGWSANALKHFIATTSMAFTLRISVELAVSGNVAFKMIAARN